MASVLSRAPEAVPVRPATVLVAVADADDRAQIEATLTATGRYTVVATEADQESVLAELSLRRDVEAVVVDAELGREVAATFARNIGTLVVTRRLAIEDLRHALSSRFVDVLVLPVSPDVLEETVEEALKRTRAAAAKTGTLVVVKSVKGGAGGSTITGQVGAAAGRLGKSVCIVELGPRAGGALSLLDVPDSPTLSTADVVAAGDLRDQQLVSAVAVARSGIGIIPGPGPLDTGAGDRGRLTQLLWQLQTIYDLVIVDAGAAGGPLFEAAAHMADRTFVVMTPDWQSLAAAGELVQQWRADGVSLSSPELVLNKADLADEVQPRTIGKQLGFTSNVTTLPNCYADLQRAAVERAPERVANREWLATIEALARSLDRTELPHRGGG